MGYSFIDMFNIKTENRFRILVLLVSLLPFVSTPGDGATFSSGTSQGNINSSIINEASGIVTGPNNREVFWINNDSGDAPRVFAVDGQARLLGTYNLSGFTARDYEDIALGPGPTPGVSYLYIGDIGDNNAVRSAGIQVYRVPEPAVYGRQHTAPVNRNLKGIETIGLVYPDGPRDAETLLVDPWSGDLYVISKRDSLGRIYRAPADQLIDGGTVTMEFRGQLPWSWATGGDVSPTGKEIIVRGYANASLWQRPAGTELWEALNGTPVGVPLVIEPQGEAICFDGTGLNYHTLSERVNQPLYLFGRTSDDGPPQPSVLIEAGSQWKFLDDGSDQGANWRGTGYVDASWFQGESQFGYGDGDEYTTVDFGNDAGNKHPTTYFRKTFDVADPDSIGKLTLKLVHDDGVAVYLNGTEILREDLTPGAAYDDFALEEQTDLEDTWFDFFPSPGLLVSGSNLLAVEVHTFGPADPDLSFDLQLSSLPPVLGDMNRDGIVNSLDITDFKNALTDLVAWEAATGRDAVTLGDFSSDGTFNSLDITGFKEALAGSSTAIPEPATVVLLAFGCLAATRHRR